MLQRSRGFGLIELMVSIVIALLAVTAIFQIFQLSEQRKRVTTGTNDAMQNGSYAAFFLQSMIKNAGSGIATMPKACGCTLHMQNNGNDIFPTGGPATSTIYTGVGVTNGWGAQTTATWKATFGQVFLPFNGNTLQFSPVYIVPGAGSNPDALIVLAGNSEGLSTPIYNTTYTATTITMPNNLGVVNGDLLLGVPPTGGVCAITQVSGVSGVLNGAGNLTGQYALANFTTVLPPASAPAFTDLGPPQSMMFRAFAIGNDPTLGTPNSLISYDMVQGNVTTVSDNVLTMKMLYVVNNNNVMQYTAATGAYSVANLNSFNSAATIKGLSGIRLALVMQNGQPDLTSSTPVTPSPIKLFSDLATQYPTLPVAINLTANQQRYRYKVIDVMIPLRTMQTPDGSCA